MTKAKKDKRLYSPRKYGYYTYYSEMLYKLNGVERQESTNTSYIVDEIAEIDKKGKLNGYIF